MSTTKHTLKLTYFDFHGGRGEPARLAMAIGDIDFEDDRVGFPRWREIKSSTPFGVVPILEVDGRQLTQSLAINRFIGKLAGLYPDDPWQAALCDEVMGAVEDISEKIVATFSITDEDAKKAARQALADGPLSLYLKGINRFLERGGGEYFADNRLTVADLRVFTWARHLRAGKLDHIPADLPDRITPLLAKHCDRMNQHPKIVAYYEARGGYGS